MGVKESLLVVSQREEGGRTAYDRFDYQTAWGIYKLLDLHDAGNNYAVAFEFHDDIISLDDADQPAKAIFYQVKTKKSGSWSFAQITSRPSRNGVQQSSFAGKMFDNFVRFGAVVERLVFVSNQPLPDIIVVHGECGFAAAEKAKLEKFVKSIAAEASGFKNPEHTSLFFFAFSDLNLSNYENTVLGRISDFLEQELGGAYTGKVIRAHAQRLLPTPIKGACKFFELRGVEGIEVRHPRRYVEVAAPNTGSTRAAA